MTTKTAPPLLHLLRLCFIQQCASLRVIQVTAVLMILFGVVTKMSIFILSIPTPIMGGLLLVLLSTFTGVGLAHLRYVDLTSSRNVFIIGVSLTAGLIIPKNIGDESRFNLTSKTTSLT